ncbi:carbohydrate sulfotransferase 8-like isoform X1 [Clavelina lepadiformis]|uniref:carbohydrate sulfotransferase 8-like isoform X1 n=1 Tax=Clavelina lepadiformis TaxID=159417 RepID=UPI0040425A87
MEWNSEVLVRRIVLSRRYSRIFIQAIMFLVLGYFAFCFLGSSRLKHVAAKDEFSIKTTMNQALKVAQADSAGELAKAEPNIEEILFLERIARRMKDRKRMMRKQCKALGLNMGEADMMRVLIAEDYKLAYCYVPKAGCSNMKKLILELNGINTNKLRNKDIHSLSKVNETKQIGMPDFVAEDNYIKLMLVRHPYERLISSYNNKILQRDRKFDMFSRQIKLLYRDPTLNDTQSPPTFPEFAEFVTNGRNSGSHNGGDPHWSKYNSLCYPCLIEYDVIAHLETIQEDTRYLLKLIKAPTKVLFQSGYSKIGLSKTEYGNFKNIYFKQLNSSQKQNLYKAYESDFKLFGYSETNNT